MFASTNGDKEVRMDWAAWRVSRNVGDREKPVPTPEISTINERRNIIEKNDLHDVLKVKNEMVKWWYFSQLLLKRTQ